jgi:hypothetical protein
MYEWGSKLSENGNAPERSLGMFMKMEYEM